MATPRAAAESRWSGTSPRRRMDQLTDSSKSLMTIRECLASDAAAVDVLFQEFVAYLRRIGDESDYRFGAQQYLTDGFGADPAFRGFVAEDASGLIGYVLYSRTY